MANDDAMATYWNTPQYHGQLLTIGLTEKNCRFLNMIGGLGGMGPAGGMRTTGVLKFPLNSENAFDGPSQQDITEDETKITPTARNYDRAQSEYNYIQIFHRGVGATYLAQSATKALSGLSIVGNVEDPNDPWADNLNMNLRQMAIDIEYHMLNGQFNESAASNEASRMAGLFAQQDKDGNAVHTLNTNKVDASADALTTDDVDALILLLKETSYAPMENMVIVGRYSALKTLTDLYGTAVMAGPTNTIGTVYGQINQIITEGGRFPLVEVPQCPPNELGFLDLKYLSPVFMPVPERNGRPGGILFYEPISKVGAADQGQIYCQISLDYTSEHYHGKIYNFT
ncbi:MAG: DUF5309 family protein [Minisyncoccales bacterium]